MNAKLTQDELQAIKERAEKYKMDMSATVSNEYRITKVDIPKLLAEIERLQAEVHEHSAHNGQLISTHVIPTKEENKRLKAEVERLQSVVEQSAETQIKYAIALSKISCDSQYLKVASSSKGGERLIEIAREALK